MVLSVVLVRGVGGSVSVQLRRAALRRPGESDDDRTRRVAASHPPGRVATLEEIVNATLFVAYDAASYLVGIDLVVDGWASAPQ